MECGRGMELGRGMESGRGMEYGVRPRDGVRPRAGYGRDKRRTSLSSGFLSLVLRQSMRSSHSISQGSISP